MPTSNPRPVLSLHTRIVPGPLRSQPKRQRRNLRRARVDIDAVDVVFNNQPWNVV
jgi:hypothetical protein